MTCDHVHVANPLDHSLEKFADVVTQEEWTTFVEWWTFEEGMALRMKNINNQKSLNILTSQGVPVISA